MRERIPHAKRDWTAGRLASRLLPALYYRDESSGDTGFVVIRCDGTAGARGVRDAGCDRGSADAQRVTATSIHPNAAHNSGAAIVTSRYQSASHQRRLRASDTISLMAAENVDMPPRKPATKIRLVA